MFLEPEDVAELLASITSLALAIQMVLIYLGARRYREPQFSICSKSGKVAAIVPVYNEDPSRFATVLRRLVELFDRVIVVGDGVADPYKTIAKAMGAEFYGISKSGKRMAIEFGAGLLRDEEFVALVDSDTLVSHEALRKAVCVLLSEYDAVTVRISVAGNDLLSRASKFLEHYKDLVQRAFAGFGKPYVLNGQFSVYRASELRRLAANLSKRRLLGHNVVIGDDKELTSRALARGLRLAYLSSVEVEASPPRGVREALLQILRWTRAGYLYLILDLKSLNWGRGWLYYYAGLVSAFSPFLGLAVFLIETRLGLSHGSHLRLPDVMFMEHFLKAMTVSFSNTNGWDPIAHFLAHAFAKDPLRLLWVSISVMSKALTGLAALGLWKIMSPRVSEDPKGAVAGFALLLLQGIISPYSLLTAFKASSWLTRASKSSRKVMKVKDKRS